MLLVLPAMILQLCQAVMVASVSVDRLDEHLMATALIQASSLPIIMLLLWGRPETEGDATAAVVNQTAKESSQSNASRESKRPRIVADSNSSAQSAKADSKAGSNSTQETAKSEEIPAASKAVASKTTEVKAEEASAIAKVDSSSEEAEAAHEQQAAEEREEAASTVLGWTPQPSATAAVNYASSYDLQNSRGSVLLWTMAATYGALTVLALLLFMICADRQRYAAQLQAEKAMAARSARLAQPTSLLNLQWHAVHAATVPRM
ncbi:unnamed protein product [Symbiodinium sp. CCMP2592]|nr:unnamed protein product [Symbiodinium sp. CCMP2592]